MSKRILTFFLAVLMLVGSVVPVFAEEADVVVHEPVMANSVDLGKREMVKEDNALGPAEKSEPVAEEAEAKDVQVTIKFVDLKGHEIAKPMVKTYALGKEKTIKAPEIKGYLKKDNTKSFTVTEGLEVELMYEKVTTDEAVVEDAKAEADELDVADVEINEPVGAEAADVSFFKFEGNTVTGLSEKGKAYIDEQVAAGGEVKLVIPAKTGVGADVTKIGDNAFDNHQLTSIVIPDTVTVIGNTSFYQNKLTNVHIPDSVTHIGGGAFSGNPLTELILGHETKIIDDGAFYGGKLTNLVIPDNVERIGAWSFFGNQLKKLVIGNSVTKIGFAAFKDNELTSLVMGDNVEIVSGMAFQNNNLTNLILPDSVKYVDSQAFAANQLEYVDLGKNIKTIGEHAFEQNNLSKVDIPDSLERMGESVFAFNNRYVKINTSNPLVKTEKVYRGFGHVVNPITIIVNYLDKETGAKIQDSKTIGDDLRDFDNIYFANQEATYQKDKIDGYWTSDVITFIPDKDGYELNLEYISTKTKPTIVADKVKKIETGDDVTETDLLRFVTATDLTGKNITDKVSVIPTKLDTLKPGLQKVTYSVTDDFGNTQKLVVDIPIDVNWFNYPIGNGWTLGDFTYEGNTVTGFSEKGLKKVEKNKHLVVPGFVPVDGVDELDKLVKVTTVGEWGFSGQDLLSVGIPESIDRIEDGAFSSNKISTIQLPDNIKYIGLSAFENNNLKFVSIPKGIDTINDSTFANNQLRNINMPNSLTSIGDSAFGRNKLQELDIPESLKSIGQGAFSGNPGSDKYSGFVVLHGPKGIEAKLPSKENYLVNPENPIVGEELNEDDFEYKKLDDGTWEISGITTKGVNKLRGNGMNLTLPTEYKGEKITSVGNETFVEKQIKSLIIPEGYERVGNTAFASNKISDLSLPKSLVSIGPWAFGQNELTKLDLLGHENLVVMDSGAFSNNKIEYINLSGCSNLENISYSVFKNNPIKKLNASGAENLKEIIHDALNGAQLEELDLSGCKSLGGYSLYELGNLSNLKTLDLSGCESLTAIPNNIFKEAKLERVDLSNCKNLESIGDHAFFKNNIKELNLEGLNSLKKIASYAFAHNDIDKLNIPESVNEVGAYAFRDNLIKNLDTKNVVNLGEGAFSDNRLEKLTFGEALTTIGSHAFEQNALVEVAIGNNVTSIGESVFAFNSRYIKVNTENPLIKNEKVYRGYGHVVNPVKITVKHINSETGESILDDKILDDDLTDINAVFKVGEENIFVPEKVKGYWIEDEVKFTPDKTDYTLTLKYIPLDKKPTIEGANIRMIAKDEVIGEKELLGFIKARDLTGKDISDKVTVSLKTLDTSTGGVKKVTYSVTDEFGNSSLVDVDIPVAIDWNQYPIGNGWVLGDFTYRGNAVIGFSQQGKEKVKINKNLIVPSFVPIDGVINVKDLAKVTTIGDWAFLRHELTTVVIPDSVTSIGDGIFAYNKLTEVVIPDSVTSIGEDAFSYNQLTSVVIPDRVTSIGEDAFRNNQLTSVVIPEGVTSIGNSAFRSNKLTSVVIPNSVTSIGDGVFRDNQLTSVNIPDSVTSIGTYAFSGNKLISVTIPDSVKAIGECAFFDNLLGKVRIGDGVTEIGKSAFQGYAGGYVKNFYAWGGKNPGNQIKELYIGKSVTTIGDWVFAYNQLASVVMGQGVTSIGNNAFRGNELTSVVIDKSVTSIGANAFSGNQLTSVVIPDSVTAIGAEAFYNNKLTEVVIPDSVTTIRDRAFRNNQLTSLVIPNSVTYIGRSAFDDNKLTSVTIGNSVTSVGDGAFVHNQLKSVVIPDSVTYIGASAFSGNQLISVVIPDSVTSIGTYAFSGNKLTSVTIPDSVAWIGGGAFEDNQLTDVIIPNSVTSIGNGAFQNNQLTSVVIPDSVTSIDGYVFYNNSLTNVVIGNSVTSIHWKAFANNPGMDYKHNVYLFTPDRTNPHNLKSVPGEYLINPTELKLSFTDENGLSLYSSRQRVVSSGSVIDLPNILGYEADIVKETGEKITDDKFTFVSNASSGIVEKTIIYKKTKISPVDGLKLETNLLTSINKYPYNYYISTDQRLNVKLNVLKDLPNIENSTIVISLPQAIDETSIKVPSHHNIKDYKIENNTLFINLQNITRNTSLEIPVLFKLNKYTTPENTSFSINTTIINSAGQYVHEVLNSTFTGYYNKPRMDILANNNEGFEYIYKWEDGPRAVGEFDFIDNSLKQKRAVMPYDYEYGFNIYNNNRDKTFIERNIESYKIEVDIPQYVALDDGGNEIIKEAIFKEDINKGWTREENKLIYTQDGLDSNKPEMPKLYLSFPQVKENAEIKLNASMVLRPKNKTKDEALINIKDDIIIYATGKAFRTGGFLKIHPTNVRYDKDIKNYIYNNKLDRSKTVPWVVYTDSFDKSKEVTNMLINVEDLPSKDRLGGRYTIDSIELKDNTPLNFTLYNKGQEVARFRLDENNKIFKLNEEIDQIVAKTDAGFVITKSIGYYINTVVENPELNLQEGIINLAGNAESLIKNGHQEATANSKLNILPFDYALKASIKNNDSDKSYVASDVVNFQVGLEDIVNDRYNHREFLTDDLHNFKELVVLPKNAIIQSIKLTDNFKNATESSYEVLDLGNGVTGILFKAKSLNKKTYDIADISIATNSSMLDASHKADVYATWDNEEVAKYKEKDSPIKALDGKVTSDSSPFVLATVKSVYSEKYVKDKGMLAYSTVSKDGNVEYLLRISNTSDNPRNNVTIVDILPYIGDDRGSEINVTLREAVNLPDARITYTTEEKPTTESRFTEGFREGITAIKIEKDVINSGETFEVNLKGKIDLPDDLQGKMNLAGKLGWNDFLRRDDLTDTFVATDKVSVEYSLPNASIEFIKYGLKKSIFFNSYKKVPLSGAEFELRDIDGNFIKSAISGPDGKVVFNDVDVKDYIIKETKAPKGYEIGSDKRVSASDFKLINNSIVASLSENFINDSVRYGNLTINKATKANKPLVGIEFKITGTDEANSKYEKLVKTDAEGKAYLNKIPEGNYKVEEIENDKWVPAEVQTFKIEQTQGDQIDGDQEIKLNFVNDKFYFKLHKIGYSHDEDLPQDLTNINLFNRGFVPGATFKINGAEYTTDKNGNITLPIDTGQDITIEEVKAPNGYILNDKKLTLKLTDDGKLLDLEGKPYNSNMLYFPNKLKEVKGNITINKVDQDGKALEGAKFALYKVEGLKETPLGEYTSNQDGKVNIKDLKPGTYKLAEISAPDGYYHDKWEKIITIADTPKGLESKTAEEAATLKAKDNYDFYTTDDTSFTREIGYKVVNKKLNVTAYKYETILSNVDEADIGQYNNKAGYKVIKSGDKYSVVKAIPNVKFNFYEGDNLIDTLTTGQDGYIDFKGYVFNENKDYKLVEIEAPDKYKIDKAPIRISISKLKALNNFDGNVNLEIENKPIKGKIVISKYDATTRLVLPGQEFTLYDSDGKKLESKITNEAGLIEFGDLELKTYTFKETAVSGNYKLDPKEYKANLSLLKRIHVEKVFNEPGTKNVGVYKVDQHDNPINGASFGIFKDGKMLYGPVKTEYGQAVFTDVKNEEGLELREVRAAEGYRLNTKSIKIDMSQDPIVIRVTNYEIEQLLPDTGTRGLIPYVLIAVGLLGIGYTINRKKKQK